MEIFGVCFVFNLLEAISGSLVRNRNEKVIQVTMSEAVLGLMLDKKETLKAAEKQPRVCFFKAPE